MIHRRWFLLPVDEYEAAEPFEPAPAASNRWVLVCQVDDDEDGSLFEMAFGWDPADKPAVRELRQMVDGYAGSVVTSRLRELGYCVATRVDVVRDF